MSKKEHKLDLYVMLTRRLNEILEDCEEIQGSNESAYTKERAKISAYNKIAYIFGFTSEK